MKYFLILIVLLSSNAFAYGPQVEQATVTEQEPIIQNVTHRVQVGENCHSVQNEASNRNSIGIDTIIGGGLGVIAGNQFHNHRDAARIGGGLLGALTANHLRKSRNSGSTTQCVPVFENIQEQEIVGYNNCAYIDGMRYCKRSKTRLKYIQFTHQIQIK